MLGTRRLEENGSKDQGGANEESSESFDCPLNHRNSRVTVEAADGPVGEEREATRADSSTESFFRSRPSSFSAISRSHRARSSSVVNARDLARSQAVSARAINAAERQCRSFSARFSVDVSGVATTPLPPDPPLPLPTTGEEEPVFCTWEEKIR